jgi:dTDP-4-dehydrorhamnose 3,5-epimerase
MIDGVQLIPRDRHADDRGYVTEILRSDEEHFEKFGQAYVTACYPGVVKAWHRHRRQIDYFYAVAGTVKVGLYDSRDGSPTRGEYQTVVLGERGENAQLVIPAGVWHGMMALGAFSVVLNIPTEVYDPDDPDEERVAWDSFEDIWTVRNR